MVESEVHLSRRAKIIYCAWGAHGLPQNLNISQNREAFRWILLETRETLRIKRRQKKS